MVVRLVVTTAKPTGICRPGCESAHNEAIGRTELGAHNRTISQRRNGKLCLQPQTLGNALLKQKVEQGVRYAVNKPHWHTLKIRLEKCERAICALTNLQH